MLRFILLAVTRRPVLTPPTPQREFDPAIIPEHKLKASAPGAPSKKFEDARPVIPEIGHRAPLRAHLYPLVASLPEEYQMHPLGLVPELCTAKEWLSEVLNSTTSLVQVLLFYYAMRHPKSKYNPESLPTLSTYFYPFLIPLAMQLVARNLRAPTGDSTLLAEHYSKLDRRLASRFFLTGPMWVGWTRPKVMSVIRGLQRIPLIGLAGGLLEGYLPLVDDYYCEYREQASCRIPALADGRHGVRIKAQCIECMIVALYVGAMFAVKMRLVGGDGGCTTERMRLEACTPPLAYVDYTRDANQQIIRLTAIAVEGTQRRATGFGVDAELGFLEDEVAFLGAFSCKSATLRLCSCGERASQSRSPSTLSPQRRWPRSKLQRRPVVCPQ